MWVERVELTSYGAISGETVLFAQDKINLVVEPNEYGKSTMATAIWSILFDFPLSEGNINNDKLSTREARRPKGSQIYTARMDLNLKDQSLTIVRDFNNQSFKVFDRNQNSLEITEQFKGKNGEDELGLKLTGMTRELFLSTCFIGQRELDEHAFGGASDLANLVQGIADSAGPSNTASQAIKLLVQTMEQVPVQDRRLKIETLIRDLELIRQDLLNKIRAYERDRQDISASFDRLMIINRVLSGDHSRFKVTEYQNLKFQITDAQARLSRLREIQNRVEALESKIYEAPSKFTVPEEYSRPIEKLLQSRKDKIEKIRQDEEELKPQKAILEERQEELKGDFPFLDQFTREENQRIRNLAGSMTVAEEELAALEERGANEREKLIQETGSQESLESLRKSTKAMEGDGLENARTYNSLILAFQEQLKDGENQLHRARAKTKELDGKRAEELKKRRLLAILLGFVSILFIVLGVIVMITTKLVGFIAPVLLIIGLGGLAGVAVIAFPIFRQDLVLRSDFAIAEADIKRLSGNVEDNLNKVRAIELKLETLARKFNLNKEDLTSKLDDYGAQTNKFKQLEVLEQMLEQKEQTLSRLRLDVQRFLMKAGRGDLDYNAASTTKLSEALNGYQEQTQRLEVDFQQATEQAKKLDQLKEALEDNNQAIFNLLNKAGIFLSGGDAEDELAELALSLGNYDSQKARQEEIAALEVEIGAGFSELPQLLRNVEDFLSRVNQQIDSLKFQYPGIENLPPTSQDEVEEQEEEAPKDIAMLEALKTEREDLLLRVRSLSAACDELYLSCLEELDLTEFRLQNAKRAKLALELARDLLARISGENYIAWSEQLNQTSGELLNKLGLDYDQVRFDNELRLVAHRRSDNVEFSAKEIMSRLSIGTKEQLHWLARLVVARYLSRQNSLPIIMDEPFSEADDDRFLKMMRFLVEVIAKEHQIILFSCHKQRHTWMKSQLDDSEKGRLVFCRRQKN
jgi:energy-coupling factor transporter ATP-binding protein EcfA2